MYQPPYPYGDPGGPPRKAPLVKILVSVIVGIPVLCAGAGTIGIVAMVGKTPAQLRKEFVAMRAAIELKA